jgi:hypothetical protein
MKQTTKDVEVVTATALVLVGLLFGTTALLEASPIPAAAVNLQSLHEAVVQNTVTSIQDPLPGHSAHQLAMVLPPRSDGKVWVGDITWTASKPVELVVLHGYKNIAANATATYGVPLTASPPSGTVAITLIKPNQFMPQGNPVPSGTASFLGNAVAFHTLSGAKFTVTYTVDGVAKSLSK